MTSLTPLLLRDLDGALHWIEPMLRRQYDRFRSLQVLASAQIESLDEAIERYDEDETFAAWVDELLTLANVHPSWLREDDRCKWAMASDSPILRLNFPPFKLQPWHSETSGEEIPDAIDPTAYQIAMLSKGCGISEAYHLLATVPWVELQGVLEALNYDDWYNGPKQKKKRRAEATKNELIKLAELGILDGISQQREIDDRAVSNLIPRDTPNP